MDKENQEKLKNMSKDEMQKMFDRNSIYITKLNEKIVLLEAEEKNKSIKKPVVQLRDLKEKCKNFLTQMNALNNKLLLCIQHKAIGKPDPCMYDIESVEKLVKDIILMLYKNDGKYSSKILSCMPQSKLGLKKIIEDTKDTNILINHKISKLELELTKYKNEHKGIWTLLDTNKEVMMKNKLKSYKKLKTAWETEIIMLESILTNITDDDFMQDDLLRSRLGNDYLSLQRCHIDILSIDLEKPIDYQNPIEINKTIEYNKHKIEEFKKKYVQIEKQIIELDNKSISEDQTDIIIFNIINLSKNLKDKNNSIKGLEEQNDLLHQLLNLLNSHRKHAGRFFRKKQISKYRKNIYNKSRVQKK
jgi:hypothetical protein